MSFTDFKEVSNPVSGTTTKYGSKDLLDIMQIFNGKTVSSKRPQIANPWIWKSWQDITEIAEPSIPATSSIQRLFIDSADHLLKLKKSDGTIVIVGSGGGGGGSGNVSTTSSNTYGDFDQIFRSSRLKLTNPANTFNYAFVGSAIAAARNITLPLLTANDNMVTEAFTQTLTNKTVNATNNTITDSSTAAGDLLKSDGTKFTRLARGTASQVLAVNAGGTDLQWTTQAGGGDMVLANVQTVTGAKTFNDTKLLLRNPADTFSVTMAAGAQTAARTYTFPVTASDTIQTIAATQTVTNKTINATNNTITDTSTAAGDLLKSDGTKFVRLARGSANQVLTVNAGGTDLAWGSGGAGSWNPATAETLTNKTIDFLLNVMKKSSGAHFILFKDADDGNKYKALNTKTGAVTTNNTDCGALLNTIKTSFVDGSTIEFSHADTFDGATDFTFPSKQRLHIFGNGAKITGFKFVVSGTTTDLIRSATIEHFYFSGANTGIRVNNQYDIRMFRIRFDACTVGISIESDNEWSEFSKIENCSFNGCQTAILFKTPTGTGTGSYVNGRIQDTTFDTQGDTANSATGWKFINLQSGADVSEGVWQNLRFWCNHDNGICLDKGGFSVRCLWSRFYFESFITATSLVAIKEEASSVASAYWQDIPVINGSGTFTGGYDNSVGNWYDGYGACFNQETSPTVGVGGTYGAYADLGTRSDGGASNITKIYYRYGGTFSAETVSVDIVIVGIDGTTTTVTKTATTTSSNTEIPIADYITLSGQRGIFIPQQYKVRAKTTKSGSTAATVTVGVVAI